MENIFEYLISVLALVFAGYLAYKHITSHPADKYHNDSWKEKRKRKK